MPYWLDCMQYTATANTQRTADLVQQLMLQERWAQLQAQNGGARGSAQQPQHTEVITRADTGVAIGLPPVTPLEKSIPAEPPVYPETIIIDNYKWVGSLTGATSVFSSALEQTRFASIDSGPLLPHCNDGWRALVDLPQYGERRRGGLLVDKGTAAMLLDLLGPGNWAYIGAYGYISMFRVLGGNLPNGSHKYIDNSFSSGQVLLC